MTSALTELRAVVLGIPTTIKPWEEKKKFKKNVFF